MRKGLPDRQYNCADGLRTKAKQKMRILPCLRSRLPSKGNIWADFWARPGVIDFEPLPLGIIVTVSGTGSECNGGAVITNEELKIKTGKDYPQLNAKFVMLDSTYTYSVPEFQMVSGAFDTLSHIMEIYFSEPNESNVSDDISEALMKNVITNLRAAIKNPEDYTARSNLMWDATMAENRIIKLGKKTDFECHQMEHQLGAYTNCNHGAGLAVLHPVYYRHICKAGEKKFAQFGVVFELSLELLEQAAKENTSTSAKRIEVNFFIILISFSLIIFVRQQAVSSRHTF